MDGTPVVPRSRSDPGTLPPVTYASYPGEEAVLDGAQQITGWKVERRGDRTCWVAHILPFLSDLNILWDVGGRPAPDGGGAPGPQEDGSRRLFTSSQARAFGYDEHFGEIDPCCRDAEGRDFTLLPTSPAFSVGLQQVDISGVGPRQANVAVKASSAEDEKVPAS